MAVGVSDDDTPNLSTQRTRGLQLMLMPDDGVATSGDSWYIAVATDRPGLAQKLKQIGPISLHSL